MDRFERAGQAFADLCRVMARLRGPGGCPWDADQSLESLKTYLLEETYEVLDAIDAAPATTEHRDELGDLLFQVVFQAEIANETQGFDAAAIVQAIHDKLIRRHPHVFARSDADNAGEALAHWEEIKAQERGPNASCMDGIPNTLPALLRAYRAGEKAAAVGFDWARVQSALAKAHEEMEELEHELDNGADRTRVSEELGDLFFALVNVARHLKIEPEDAARQAVLKFERRFRHVEQQLRDAGRSPRDASLEELEERWLVAKKATAGMP